MNDDDTLRRQIDEIIQNSRGEVNSRQSTDLMALFTQYARQERDALIKDLDSYTAEHDQPFVQWTRDWLELTAPPHGGEETA